MVLAAVVLGLAPLAEPVPHAALAGILIKVGWDIIDWGFLRRAHRAPREEVLVMAITLVLTVFVDLITAVAVGIILASFVTARWIGKEEIRAIERVSIKDEGRIDAAEREVIRRAEGRIVLYRFAGSFSYASARELARVVAIDPQNEVIVLDFSDAGKIDLTAALAIEELVATVRRGGNKVVIAGLSNAALKALERLKALDQIPAYKRFETRRQALDYAAKLPRR